MLTRSVRVLEKIYGTTSTYTPDDDDFYINPVAIIDMVDSMTSDGPEIKSLRNTVCRGTIPKCVSELLTPTVGGYNHPIKFSESHKVNITSKSKLYEEQARDKCTFTPQISARHYMSQAKYGRVCASKPSVVLPFCENGRRCAANVIKNNGGNGPLHIYLTETQEEIFNRQGVVPHFSRFCVICHSVNYQSQLLHTNMCINPSQQLGQVYRITPPFSVLVGPGEFSPMMMIAYEDGTKMANIPRISEMMAKINAATKTVEIDVSACLFHTQIASPLN